ncbi:MAG: MFS transporter [Bacteroidetes bacterium]|nr:MFS transporter [Bacteroidota bacterium]
MTKQSQSVSNTPFLIIISVFFFWGFVAASNDILIPVFKERLHLLQWQSQMISFAFYVAYTVGSVLYYFISKTSKGDILNRIGYKNGIALGLVISAFGTLLFYPAAQNESFLIMITGLFIVGLGFSLQQTVANPLTIILGDASKGSQRLSMAGGINNIGTTIGPLLISFAIFGSINSNNISASIESIKIPYLILGAAFLVFALIFKFSSIPDKIENIKEIDIDEKNEKSSALKYPQLVYGMIAIFVYVGVEVSTASNLPEFMKYELAMPASKIAPYISLYWASLMIGRWTSSVDAFNLKGGIKKIVQFLMPYIAFGFFLLVNKIANHDITPFYIYIFVIVALIVADIASKGDPAKQLFIFSAMGILALFTGIFSSGMVSVYAFISVGLFCSTLWPCIFTLAIAGLGKKTNQGSSFLIMMIMGGGIISLIQGYLAEPHILGIKWSYTVGVICFLYLAFYALKVKKILKIQGVNYIVTSKCRTTDTTINDRP